MSRIPFSLAALDHVVLRVPDMGKALEFYRDTLGACEERRIEQFGIVQLRAGHSLIDLVDLGTQWLRAEGARPFMPEARNVDHFCLRIEPFDEAAIEKYLKARGVEIGERGVRYGAQGNGPSIYVRDPFGTVVELKGPATPVEADGPVLRTAGLFLRPLRMADAEALLPIFRDEETLRYWAHAPIKSLSEMHDIIARNLPPQNLAAASFAITRDHGRAIGAANFYSEHDSIAGMGYIIDKAWWGQGLVSEAVRAMVEHGFGTLKLQRIWLEIDPRNQGSIRVAQKAGFAAEGHFRKSFFLNGAYFDSVYYAMLAEDWLKTRASVSPSAR